MLFTAGHEEPRRALQKSIAAEINPSCSAGRDRVMSGCVSSEGWHVQQETNLPG
jgi:hypothetical protein